MPTSYTDYIDKIHQSIIELQENTRNYRIVTREQLELEDEKYLGLALEIATQRTHKNPIEMIKAIVAELPEEYINPADKYMISTLRSRLRAPRDNEIRFYPAYIGHPCIRYSVLSLGDDKFTQLYPDHFNISGLFSMTIGTALHALFAQAIEIADWAKEENVEAEVGFYQPFAETSQHRYVICGRADLLKKDDWVVDWKVVSDYVLKEAKRGRAKSQYIEQIAMMAHAFNVERGWLHFISRAKPDQYELVEVESPLLVWESTVKPKLQTIIQYLEAEVLPPAGGSYYDCKYCQFAPLCRKLGDIK